MSRPVILGVPVDAITKVDARARILTMLTDPHQYHVMTPNAEMLVASTKDAEFLSVLQKSDLNLADSTGLVVLSRLIGQSLPERVTGVDTVTNLCYVLTADHPVFLLGAGDGIAERAAEVLKSKNPQLKIAGTFAGTPKEEDAPAIINRIHHSGAHLLLVAYGAPKQDIWIEKHLKELPSVRVAMGVGGTFDFISGNQIRAPKFLRALGLEWLWRLVREPSRFPRIFNAVIRFPWFVLVYRSRSPRAAAR